MLVYQMNSKKSISQGQMNRNNRDCPVDNIYLSHYKADHPGVHTATSHSHELAQPEHDSSYSE
jgi:hypothetical protein